MNELSLFTGIGGGLLGTKLLGWRSIGYVEIDEYCQRVLQQRIKDGILDDAPIFGDIREFNRTYAKEFKGVVDVITAGFPCQPFSLASPVGENGRRGEGERDNRNMWPATVECIGKIRPRFALLENVPNIATHEYIRKIHGDLAEIGYDAIWIPITASFVGALHERKRLFILAYPYESGLERYRIDKEITGNVRQARLAECPINGSKKVWCENETDILGMVDGIPNRVDRLKAIGNAQVPAVVRAVWELLNDRQSLRNHR